ncbi:MAG: hypothetical protein ACR2HF_12060 [Methylococcaceae bacterium]
MNSSRHIPTFDWQIIGVSGVSLDSQPASVNIAARHVYGGIHKIFNKTKAKVS